LLYGICVLYSKKDKNIPKIVDIVDTDSAISMLFESKINVPVLICFKFAAKPPEKNIPANVSITGKTISTKKSVNTI